MWTSGNGSATNYPLLYVESSSMSDGTWAEDVIAENVTIENGWAWFIQGSPISTVGSGDKIMEIEWSSENVTNNTTGLYAISYNGTGWDNLQTVAIEGGMNHSRPDAFSFYDLGSAIHVTYTNDGGEIMYRGRSQIQTWNGTAAATLIKPDGTTLRIPTLSGYENIGAGEDLICIVADNNTLWYDIKPYGGAFPGVWTEIWSNPYIDITRHVAQYKYSSPLGFAWQQIETTGDDIEYWWIDNTNDTVGYYPSNTVADLPATSVFQGLVIVALIVGAVFLLITALTGQLTYQALAYIGVGVILVYVVVTLLMRLLF